MRRVAGYRTIGVLRLTGGDLALFEEIEREGRSERHLEPRGHWKPPPVRMVMYYPATSGKATLVKSSDDLKAAINSEPNITTVVADATEMVSAVIACIADLGIVVPGESRSFAPFFYRFLVTDQEDSEPQFQHDVLRFACRQPRPVEQDPSRVSVSVRFNPLEWRIVEGTNPP